MTWPVWFVIGLVLLAALLTVIYTYWLSRAAGYFEVPASDYYINVFHREDGMIASIHVHKAGTLQAPSQLVTSLLRQHTLTADQQASVVPVITEPGYNAYKVWDKYTSWFSDGYESWRSSIFFLAMLPIELILQSSVFAMSTMMDMVSHNRRMAACIITAPTNADNPSDAATIAEGIIKRVKKDVSLIESYNSSYIHIADDSPYRYDLSINNPFSQGSAYGLSSF